MVTAQKGPLFARPKGFEPSTDRVEVQAGTSVQI